ncbi:MAG: hypothetical protein Q7S92_06255 [Candidatus Diapherotrites archaeon]|nr:hypothetical protein [Candidatus Diapherotrites archaeon]
MQNKILLIGLIALALILLGCTQGTVNLGCQIQNCGHAVQNPTCGPVPIDQQCPAIAKFEDYCLKFVDCSTENNSCTTQIEPEYNSCYDCFMSCKNQENQKVCMDSCQEQFK